MFSGRGWKLIENIQADITITESEGKTLSQNNNSTMTPKLNCYIYLIHMLRKLKIRVMAVRPSKLTDLGIITKEGDIKYQ